jgi:hypothetical protein
MLQAIRAEYLAEIFSRATKKWTLRTVAGASHKDRVLATPCNLLQTQSNAVVKNA